MGFRDDFINYQKKYYFIWSKTLYPNWRSNYGLTIIFNIFNIFNIFQFLIFEHWIIVKLVKDLLQRRSKSFQSRSKSFKVVQRRAKTFKVCSKSFITKDTLITFSYCLKRRKKQKLKKITPFLFNSKIYRQKQKSTTSVSRRNEMTKSRH